jgi:hypothetical protein
LSEDKYAPWEEIKALIDKEIGFRLVSPDECRIVYETSLSIEPKEILEIGLWLGTFTIPMLLYCKQAGAHLTTIDRKLYPDTERLIERLGLNGNWTFINNTSAEAAKTWAKNIDMLVIDSSHSYYDTIAELRFFSTFSPKEILLHDVLHKAHGKDIMLAVTDFLMDKREWVDINGPRIPCWNFEVYNTWCGMGRLYRTLGECGHRSG